MEPGEMLPLTLGTDEGKPEVKIFSLHLNKRRYASQIRSKLRRD
jgi:hypothetical protein